MIQTELNKTIATIKRIDKLKVKMSKDRDTLRSMVDDLNDILDSWDRGLESLDYGIRSLEGGVDELSELL